MFSEEKNDFQKMEIMKKWQELQPKYQEKFNFLHYEGQIMKQ